MSCGRCMVYRHSLGEPGAASLPLPQLHCEHPRQIRRQLARLIQAPSVSQVAIGPHQCHEPLPRLEDVGDLRAGSSNALTAAPPFAGVSRTRYERTASPTASWTCRAIRSSEPMVSGVALSPGKRSSAHPWEIRSKSITGSLPRASISVASGTRSPARSPAQCDAASRAPPPCHRHRPRAESHDSRCSVAKRQPACGGG